MKITQLTPGTGHFLCGNCLRDDALARALRRRGHDVSIIPLYLPLVVEGAPPPGSNRIFMGGINLFLQQKLPLLRHLPAWLTRLLDRPGLLRWSSTLGDMTDSSHLGDMTIEMLQGHAGRHAHELARLVEWMKHHDTPDVIVLSNVLLAGMVQPIREALHRPVACTLQGEDAFLDALPDSHRDRAWAILAERARMIDAFIPVSNYYGQTMSGRLALAVDRMHTVHNGIELDDIVARQTPRPDGVKRIGYLARMCRAKGLHTLVDAFLELRRRDRSGPVQLHVLGVMLKSDRELVREVRRRITAAGLESDVTFTPNADRSEKIEFLRSIDVLSVPATYGEAFGLYLLEAMAAGVPVVQPRHGAFPEILEATGGGVLCEPDDPESLVDALESLLLDDARREALGRAGRAAVESRFTADHMAAGVEAVLMRRQRTAPAREPAAAHDTVSSGTLS